MLTRDSYGGFTRLLWDTVMTAPQSYPRGAVITELLIPGLLEKCRFVALLDTLFDTFNKTEKSSKIRVFHVLVIN